MSDYPRDFDAMQQRLTARQLPRLSPQFKHRVLQSVSDELRAKRKGNWLAFIGSLAAALLIGLNLAMPAGLAISNEPPDVKGLPMEAKKPPGTSPQDITVADAALLMPAQDGSVIWPAENKKRHINLRNQP